MEINLTKEERKKKMIIIDTRSTGQGKTFDVMTAMKQGKPTFFITASNSNMRDALAILGVDTTTPDSFAEGCARLLKAYKIFVFSPIFWANQEKLGITEADRVQAVSFLGNWALFSQLTLRAPGMYRRTTSLMQDVARSCLGRDTTQKIVIDEAHKTLPALGRQYIPLKYTKKPRICLLSSKQRPPTLTDGMLFNEYNYESLNGIPDLYIYGVREGTRIMYFHSAQAANHLSINDYDDYDPETRTVSMLSPIVYAPTPELILFWARESLQFIFFGDEYVEDAKNGTFYWDDPSIFVGGTFVEKPTYVKNKEDVWVEGGVVVPQRHFNLNKLQSTNEILLLTATPPTEYRNCATLVAPVRDLPYRVYKKDAVDADSRIILRVCETLTSAKQLCEANPSFTLINATSTLSKLDAGTFVSYFTCPILTGSNLFGDIDSLVLDFSYPRYPQVQGMAQYLLLIGAPHEIIANATDRNYITPWLQWYKRTTFVQLLGRMNRGKKSKTLVILRLLDSVFVNVLKDLEAKGFVINESSNGVADASVAPEGESL